MRSQHDMVVTGCAEYKIEAALDCGLLPQPRPEPARSGSKIGSPDQTI